MNKGVAAMRFVVFSALGVFMFFVPITWKGSSSVPLDHIVTWVRTNLTSLALLYGLLVTAIGGIMPWATGTWKKSRLETVFSVLKLLGVVVALIVYLKAGPAWLMDKNVGPFLFEKLVVPVGLIVPVGSVFLAFLVGYGLM